MILVFTSQPVCKRQWL